MVCSKCGTEKIRRNNRWICRPCQIKYQKDHYNRNLKSERLKRVEAARNREAERYALLIQLKDVPYTDCGNKFPHYVMEFDHLGNKIKAVSKMLGWNIDKLMNEIKKCEIVCANCHRIRTWSRHH